MLLSVSPRGKNTYLSYYVPENNNNVQLQEMMRDAVPVLIPEKSETCESIGVVGRDDRGPLTGSGRIGTPGDHKDAPVVTF